MHLRQRPDPPTPSSETLQDLIRAAIASSKSLGHSVLLSFAQTWQCISPLAFLARQSKANQPKFYWEQPELGLKLAAAGAAVTIDDFLASQGKGTFTNRINRFNRAKQFAQFYLDHAVVGGAVDVSKFGRQPSPTLLGGFAFYNDINDAVSHNPGNDQPERAWVGFPETMLFIPRWQIQQIDSACVLIVNHCVQPQDCVETIEEMLLSTITYLQAGTADAIASPNLTPEFKSKLSIVEVVGDRPWVTKVAQAIDLIEQGKLNKVVLSRALDVTAPHQLDPFRVLQALSHNYPECISFLVDFGRNTTFLGATPELLLQFQHQQNGLMLRTGAVAGSTQRGQSLESDRYLGDRLMHSKKDRSEHQIVVNSIYDRLTNLQATIGSLEPPGLLKLSNVQHLYTPIAAELPNSAGLSGFDVLEQLHPTAAVGGDPNQTAIALMREWEACDRGWYAAPVGWINGNGEGAFAVGIRSGYLEGNKARIYAGAGIVADSEAEAELKETNIKFEALLKALQQSLD